MLEYLKNEANQAYTENGALSYATTASDCLDLFATVGALRSAEDWEIVERFLRAFAENRDVAMKLLFFARDIRGGLGERRVFRVVLNWLAHNEPETVRKNIGYVAEYGRFDDLLALMDTPCEKDMLKLLHTQLRKSKCWVVEGESCIKYLPLKNTNFIHIDGVVETPPNVDEDIFAQQFINWIESLGYCFGGGISPANDD